MELIGLILTCLLFLRCHLITRRTEEKEEEEEEEEKEKEEEMEVEEEEVMRDTVKPCSSTSLLLIPEPVP